MLWNGSTAYSALRDWAGMCPSLHFACLLMCEVNGWVDKPVGVREKGEGNEGEKEERREGIKEGRMKERGELGREGGREERGADIKT